MTIKFKEKVCECGLDLTTAIPVRVEGIDDETVIGGCPNCQRRYFMTDLAPPPAPEPPVARGGRRRASEPEPEPEPVVGPEASSEE